MRGGKRDGAGRKPSEETVRVSVPVGILGQVQALVESYKQQQLKTDQIIKRFTSLAAQQLPIEMPPEQTGLAEKPQPAGLPDLNESQQIKHQALIQNQTLDQLSNRSQPIRLIQKQRFCKWQTE